MKRPSFQFYTGDWKKNAKLRRCSPAARGVWVDVLCLFHDAEPEYGLLRWPLKDVANAAGASMAHVRELVEKGVLKGSDRDAPAFVYRPKHAGKEGDPVVLVIADGGPVWYSSRMVRDEYVRQKRGESTRFDTANNPSSRSPKGGIGGGNGDGPSTSSSPSGSEAKASDAASASSAPDKSDDKPKREVDIEKRRLWSEALTLVMERDRIAESTARSFFGELSRDYRDVVREALDIAMKAEIVGDIRAYLKATCQRLSGGRNTVPSDAADKTRAALDADTAHASDLSPEQRAERIAKARAAAAAASNRNPTEKAPATGEATHVDD